MEPKLPKNPAVGIALNIEVCRVKPVYGIIKRFLDQNSLICLILITPVNLKRDLWCRQQSGFH